MIKRVLSVLTGKKYPQVYVCTHICVQRAEPRIHDYHLTEVVQLFTSTDDKALWQRQLHLIHMEAGSMMCETSGRSLLEFLGEKVEERGIR